MSLYQVSLGALILANAVLFGRQRLRRRGWVKQNDETEKANRECDDAEALKRNFMITYLVAYLLATATDWLQVCRIPILRISSCSRVDVGRDRISMQSIDTTKA